MARLLSVLVLVQLIRLVCGGVIWIPEDFDPAQKGTLLPRDGAACGGLSGFTSCGSAFPSDFCCPQSSTCLALNTTSSVKAVICCPAGQDCSSINPVSCDQGMQNATSAPSSELHSEPTQKLDSCGGACCPLGYSCNGNTCVSQPPPAASSISTSSQSSSPTASVTSKAPAVFTSTSTYTPTPAAPDTTQSSSSATSPKESIGKSSDSKISGASFAAGFIPGIAIGALIAGCIIVIISRRRHKGPIYMDEKNHGRDTLTDLGPKPMHNRSISEPIADPYAGYRTEFLRSTPPRSDGLSNSPSGYTVEVAGPVTPARTPKIKNLFSHSPFMNFSPASPVPTQPPVPAHLKRGTLSFKISPVRALKKQKSMHSLRRQMDDASRNNHQQPTNLSRSDSQETIKVLWPGDKQTPDHKSSGEDSPYDDPPILGSATYQAPYPSTKWEHSTKWRGSELEPLPLPRYPMAAPYASSSHYSSNTTPTRAQGPTASNGTTMLGTPYTPSQYKPAAKVPEKRDTTFSALMERAGLRKSDLLMGSDRERI